ncbi:MAG: 6,7-dimethyl-8-ribityllumazine synthase [Limisphaerales bacterium]
MLTPARKSRIRASHGSFAIIASRYNTRYVDAMIKAARTQLKKGGAKTIRVLRVPGAFEIPAVAARLAQSTRPWSAIICLGVILRGQTSHAQQIADAVSLSLAQLQIQRAIPVIHEVLLLENEAQAIARCLDEDHNRGAEAAQTALEMARVMASLPLS